MGGLSMILLNLVFLAIIQSVTSEGQECSRFHYEEQTLYKMVKMEARLEELEEQMEAGIEDLEKEVAELKLLRELDEPKTCADEWVTFKSHCYLFGTTGMDFKSAENFCKEKGSHLVSIHNVLEGDFVRRHVTNLKAPNFWIGLTDEAVEGVWRWVDTDEEADYFDWCNGQPNQGRVSNCGAIWETRNNQWVDEPCSGNRFNPICKK